MEHKWEDYFDIESEYWKKAQEIYGKNEHFPKIVIKNRNLHHKFPKSFSKKDGVEIDNDEDNLVSLSLSDHFLVHYYLWKCSKKGYRQMMALAFSFMRKKMVKYASEETIEQLAKDYENIMKEVSKDLSLVNKGRHHTEEAKKKMRDARKGKPGKPHSEEWKRMMSEAMKGNSWNKGRHQSKELVQKRADALRGHHHTKESRKKMAESHKGQGIGKHWYNNSIINIQAIECPEGFVPGRLKWR